MSAVVVFDLDGTLTRRDTFKLFLRTRLRARPWRWLSCAPLPLAWLLARGGWRDHDWLKQVALTCVVGGAQREELAAFCREFAEQVMAEEMLPGALAVLEHHRAEGGRLVLCSASFDFYVEAIGAALGMDKVISTRAAWRGDRLSGGIDGRNCFAGEKIRRLDAWLGERARGQRVAYSDHHSDLPLLEWADRAVAANPTARLRQLAGERGMEITDWRVAA